MPFSRNFEFTVFESAENRSAVNAPVLWFEEDDIAKGAKIAAFLVIFLASLIKGSK